MEYYRKMVRERNTPDSRGNYGNWQSCLRYLEMYCDENTTFRDVTPEFILGFKDFLENVEKTPISAKAHAGSEMSFKDSLKIQRHLISENCVPA